MLSVLPGTSVLHRYDALCSLIASIQKKFLSEWLGVNILKPELCFLAVEPAQVGKFVPLLVALRYRCKRAHAEGVDDLRAVLVVGESITARGRRLCELTSEIHLRYCRSLIRRLTDRPAQEARAVRVKSGLRFSMEKPLLILLLRLIEAAIEGVQSGRHNSGTCIFYPEPYLRRSC